MTLATERVRAALTGISGILVTPMDAEDRIHPSRLAPIIARAAAAGVDALTVNGNTGEFYGLSFAEAERMQAEVPALVAGRAAVVAGVGRSIAEATALARRARADGADAIMVHQPPDPFVAPRGVVAYVATIADAAGLPVVLYLRNDGIGLPAIEALCKVPGVVGVKWATPNVMVLAQAIRRAGPDVSFICGLAEPWAPPMYAVGARGFTSGLINLRPELSVRIHAALAKGDYTLATELIGGIATFEELRTHERNGANVSVVKTALQYAGLDCGAARPPSTWPLPEADLAQLKRLVDGWK